MFRDIFRKILVVRFLSFFVVIIVNQQEALQEYFLIHTSSTPDKIVFALPGSPFDWGIDAYEEGVHGAAGQWDYLFEDENGQQVYTPTGASGSVVNSGSVTSGVVATGAKKGPVLDSYVETGIVPGTGVVSSGTDVDGGSFDKDIGSITKEPILEPSVTSGTLVDDIKKSCKTPWGEELEHKDFVLAYKQRTDVTNICDVQKRYCVNGKLTGSYPQKYCREDTRYSYIKKEVVAYNDKKPDPLIQPSKPSLSGANFDTHGKINTTEQPIDVWGTPNSGVSQDGGSVPLVIPADKSCTTPWGEKVKNGHIVKAYSAPIGLIDVPCEVEIRLCVDGKLKGTFKNRTCTFKKMTYRDYVVGNYDVEKPTVGDLINTVQTEEKETTFRNSAFRKWLDKVF